MKSMLLRKELFYRNTSLGIVGECTGIRPKCGSPHTFLKEENLKVGDVVSFYNYEQIYTRVVVKNFRREKEKYGIFGFGSDTLDFDKLTKVMSYKDITEDIFQKLQESYSGEKRENFTIKDIIQKEMTIKQIQDELGYPIKIIGG